jgi:His-Xaa-Ser system protein HxsD
MNIDSNNIIFFNIDKELFSNDAILQTSYKFTDIYYCEIKTQDSTYMIVLKPKNFSINKKNIKEDFLNELIDQQLRVSLYNKTYQTREMIVKKAFFPFLEKEDDKNE